MRKVLLLGVLAALLISTQPAAARDPDEGAFRRVWAAIDGPVANGSAQRPWFWGPEPFMTFDEDYIEGIGGQRRVQYWDKGRMEISNPNDDPSDPWYVTSGLLPLEMIRGRVQLGDDEFERRDRAQIPIVGDDDPRANPDAPTYADFFLHTTVFLDSRLQPVTNNPIGPGNADSAAPPRFGDLVAQEVNADGRVVDNPELAAAYPGTRIVYYDGVFSHNIPEVFWNFLQTVEQPPMNGSNRQDMRYDWVYLIGHPASEPYWVQTLIGGVEQYVMVQVYERRVLSYNPNNPPGYQVEMANSGRHYYNWRYAEPAATAPTEAPQIRPDNVNATVSPQEGPLGTEFAVTLIGFDPGEEISIWLTLPDQSVQEAPELGVANENGEATLFGEVPITIFTFENNAPGIWALTGQGTASGHTAIAYFTATEP